MMENLTLTFVKNEDKVSKGGKKYTACTIKASQYGDQWINGFGNWTTRDWEVGDTVVVETWEEEYNGKMYRKFKTVKKEDLLEIRVKKLEDRVFGGQGKPMGSMTSVPGQALPAMNEMPDDLPF